MTDWHRWTEEEIGVVRRDYAQNRASLRDIANHLGVSEHTVAHQVDKLGLRKRPERKSWTLKEDDYLREVANELSPNQIAKKMKRSVNSVVVRMKRLKLHRRYRNGWYTKNEVCEILGVDHKFVQTRINRGELKAYPHNGSIPKQYGGACWHIKEENLKEYILEYPHELNGRNVDLIQIIDLLVGLKR